LQPSIANFLLSVDLAQYFLIMKYCFLAIACRFMPIAQKNKFLSNLTTSVGYINVVSCTKSIQIQKRCMMLRLTPYACWIGKPNKYF